MYDNTVKSSSSSIKKDYVNQVNIALTNDLLNSAIEILI